jgi:hypothetical protein
MSVYEVVMQMLQKNRLNYDNVTKHKLTLPVHA